MGARRRKLNQRLPDFKRISGVLEHAPEFPRTASMKLKRGPLAEQLRAAHNPDHVQLLGETA